MKIFLLTLAMLVQPTGSFAYFAGGIDMITKVLASPRVKAAELKMVEKDFVIAAITMLEDDGSDGAFGFKLRFKKFSSPEPIYLVAEGRGSREGDNSVDVYTLGEAEPEQK